MIKKVKLGEVADLSIGFVGTVTPQYENGGIPFLRTLNVKPYKIIDNDLKRITKEFHESQKKSKLMEGDVAMVHTGVPGICCVIPEEYNNSNCIDMIVIKPHKDKINAHYLAAYMNTVGYKHIEKQQVGCIQKHFNLKDAEELEIFLPDIETQNKIGEMVNNINNKIENNNAINAELESMAKTIYDYWFLQFEFPNEDGKPYKSSGGKMVWNEELKREIPEGWEVGTFGDVISSLECGDRPSGGAENEGIPSIGAENIISIGKYDFSSEKYISDVYFQSMKCGIVKSWDVLIYKDGAGVGQVSMFGDGFPYDKCAINSHVFILRSENNIFQNYLYLTLTCEHVKKILKTLAMKAAQPGLNQPAVKSIPLVVPPQNVLKKFNIQCDSFFHKIFNCANENKELASLRDFLLPMLMNGQVGFKD